MTRSLLIAALLAATQTLAAQTSWPTKSWPTSTPAAEGLDGKVLAAFDADIAAGKYGFVDSLLVIRHGKAVLDRTYKHDYATIYAKEAAEPGPLNANDPSGPYNYFNPWWHPFYRGGDLHTMQSVTKSVTSIVIGIATTRKEFPSLDTPVLQFFDSSKIANVDDRKRRMTLRHLLTMTSGLDWDEDVPYADPRNDSSRMEASFDWVRYTIDRPMALEPGTAFKYSSGVTQLLSYIFWKATKQDIEEYANRYLFTPLGIDRFFWKRSPTGLVDTEGGLFLRTHDLAKIAYLYAKNGVWDGKVIVQPEWVKQSLSPSIAVADGVQYGFKWWLYPYAKGDPRLAWGGSGFGGQRPLYFSDYDLLVVSTGWNVLPGRPTLTPRITIDRILEAVVDRSATGRGASRGAPRSNR
jgi:CubicO group peptidase (beta-lactamase class C family)